MRLALPLATLLVLPSVVCAKNLVWTGRDGGSIADAENWNGTELTEADAAFFTDQAAGKITVDKPHEIRRIQFQRTSQSVELIGEGSLTLTTSGDGFDANAITNGSDVLHHIHVPVTVTGGGVIISGNLRSQVAGPLHLADVRFDSGEKRGGLFVVGEMTIEVLDVDSPVTVNLNSDFEAGGQLTIGNSSDEIWSADVRVIGFNPDVDRISVSDGGLTAAQLERISFVGYGRGAKIVDGTMMPND